MLLKNGICVCIRVCVLFHILFHRGLSSDASGTLLVLLRIRVCLCWSQTPTPSLPNPSPLTVTSLFSVSAATSQTDVLQESTSELLERKKDLEVLQNLLKEISSHGLPGDKALVFEKTNNLSKKFKEMEDTVKEK